MEVTNDERRAAMKRLRELLDGGTSFPEDVAKAVIGKSQYVYSDIDPSIRKVIAMIAPQLPDDVEWPRFKDGELLGLGDGVNINGRAYVVDSVLLDARGAVLGVAGGISWRVERGAPVIRRADSWERLIGDAVAADDEGTRGMCEALVLRAQALAGEGE